MKEIILIFILYPCFMYGQYSKIEVLPPEAASLMRYVDYPVSHLTGIPDIQIPLHTVNVGKLVIPLTLSFHMDNYLRANQIIGSVGRGWSLSTELQVTRAINGFDDLSTLYHKLGYCANNLIPDNYKEGDVINRTYLEMGDLYKERRDEEPDRFYYKLLDKSGAFYFKHQQDGSVKPIPVPYNGVEITYSDGQFTIIDTDGTKYIFSTSKRDWERVNSNESRTYMAWKCEKIITSDGKDEISFTHNKEKTITVNSFNDRIEVYDNIQALLPDIPHSAISPLPWRLSWKHDETNINQTEPPFWRMTGAKAKEIAGYKATTLVKHQDNFVNLIKGDDNGHDYIGSDAPSRTLKLLAFYSVSEIKFRGGAIQFEYVSNAVLNSIKIINNNGIPIKTISFQQSGIGSPDEDYSRTIKYLTVGDEKYSFTYPSRIGGLDMMTDYWGYELRPTNNTTRKANVTQHKIEVSTGNCMFNYDCTDINPRPTVATMTVGYDTPTSILSYKSYDKPTMTIKYPTGGSTEFIMGQHQFRSSFDNTIKGAGGYRIENIKYYDNTSSLLKEKHYKYGPNEDGCGIAKDEPYFDGPLASTLGTGYFQQEVLFYWGSGYDIENNGGRGYIKYLSSTARKRTYLNGSNQRNSFEGGSTVNYNEVAEYEMDRGVNSGKTVYKFNPHTALNTGSPINPYPLEQEEWDFGILDSIIHYKYQNGKFDWVKKQKFLYNKYVDSVQIFRGRIWSKVVPELVHTVITYIDIQQWKYEQAHNYLTYDKRGLNTGCMQLLKKEELTMDGNGDIVKEVVNYFYDNPNKYTANRVERTLSDGSTMIEQTLYPEDYNSSEGMVANLLSRNMVSIPIEKIQRINGKVVFAELYTYNNLGYLETVNKLEVDNPNESSFRLSNKSTSGQYLPESGRSEFNKDDGYKEITCIQNYDSYGNPSSVKTRTAPYKVCYLWGYNGLYPIVEIQNTDYMTVYNKLGATLINRITVSDSPSTADMREINLLKADPMFEKAHISTYTYDTHIGLRTGTDPQNITTYYDYDRFSRLKEMYINDGNVKKTIKMYDYNYIK